MAKTRLPCTCSPLALVFVAVFVQQWLVGCGGGNLNDEFNILWGGGRGRISGDGTILSLTMDSASGSGFRSKNEFMFGKIDMEIKLIPGNSAGTVTTYYLSSEGPTHDEIDFEFLGNVSGDPYTIHTNIYTQGKGEREQQFRLWFDPTSDFHTYSMIWTPQTIIFAVNDTPIREFKNLESVGVPFPNKQPMMLYSSLFCGDQWATRGGSVKTDWSQAPFTASYRNFNAIGGESLRANFLDRNKLKWVQENHMIYNYCTDTKRFPQGFPPECKTDNSV